MSFLPNSNRVGILHYPFQNNISNNLVGVFHVQIHVLRLCANRAFNFHCGSRKNNGFMAVGNPKRNHIKEHIQIHLMGVLIGFIDNELIGFYTLILNGEVLET